MIYSYNI